MPSADALDPARSACTSRIIFDVSGVTFRSRYKMIGEDNLSRRCTASRTTPPSSSSADSRRRPGGRARARRGGGVLTSPSRATDPACARSRVSSRIRPARRLRGAVPIDDDAASSSAVAASAAARADDCTPGAAHARRVWLASGRASRRRMKFGGCLSVSTLRRWVATWNDEVMLAGDGGAHLCSTREGEVVARAWRNSSSSRDGRARALACDQSTRSG